VRNTATELDLCALRNKPRAKVEKPREVRVARTPTLGGFTILPCMDTLVVSSIAALAILTGSSTRDAKVVATLSPGHSS
jgi:hypothetical protein